MLDDLLVEGATECEKIVQKSIDLDLAYHLDRKDQGGRLQKFVDDQYKIALESLQGGDDGDS